jgi:DUF4097 and DUF4098 domain-containing protein YvlB
MRDNRDKELSCESQRGGRWRTEHRCDLREQTLASTGRLTADAGNNGGVTVKGWTRNDVLVRSRIDVWAESDAEANALLSQVHVEAANGTVSATGPEHRDHRGWSVSYEIFVPRKTAVSATAKNGGLSVRDVDGEIHVETKNGGIQMARVAGDVSGATRNGGVSVELAGSRWEGKQLDLSTRNGGVSVLMPQNYSAHVEAETVHGRVLSDLPLTVSGWIRRQNVDGTLGSGGPLIHVSTVNGGIVLKRS